MKTGSLSTLLLASSPAYQLAADKGSGLQVRLGHAENVGEPIELVTAANLDQIGLVLTGAKLSSVEKM